MPMFSSASRPDACPASASGPCIHVHSLELNLSLCSDELRQVAAMSESGICIGR